MNESLAAEKTAKPVLQKRNVMVRLAPPLARKLEKTARAQGRSLGNLSAMLIEQGLRTVA